MSFSEVMTVLEAVQNCAAEKSSGLPLERFRIALGTLQDDRNFFGEAGIYGMVAFSICFHGVRGGMERPEVSCW